MQNACAYDVRKAPICDLPFSIHKTRGFEWQTAHTKECQKNRCESPIYSPLPAVSTSSQRIKAVCYGVLVLPYRRLDLQARILQELHLSHPGIVRMKELAGGRESTKTSRRPSANATAANFSKNSRPAHLFNRGNGPLVRSNECTSTSPDLSWG